MKGGGTMGEALAAELEAVNGQIATAIEGCTAEQWGMTVAGEERPVGVVFHHMASIYPFAVDWSGRLARGENLPEIAYDVVHQYNAQHAEKSAGASAAEVKTLLAENGAALAAHVRGLSDEQLANRGPFSLVSGREVSAKQVVEWFAIGHARNHLEAIQKTLGESG